MPHNVSPFAEVPRWAAQKRQVIPLRSLTAATICSPELFCSTGKSAANSAPNEVPHV